MDTPQPPNRIALLFSLALEIVLGVVGMWNTTVCESPPKPSITPLGIARQQLLDALAGSFTLERVEEKPDLYVVKLGNSTAACPVLAAASEKAARFGATHRSIFKQVAQRHVGRSELYRKVATPASK